jgi:hypothetical protein
LLITHFRAESTDATAAKADSSSFNIDNERTLFNAENANFMDGIKKGDSAPVAALYTHDAL